ncbi:hypothetical protein GRF29_44g2443573 [Pseudopithomyces chartarum]|uniref:NAD(P)-binding protein n=1 Tax=Pseudopithomyces chartarum TaxID=1892770 RepID=A0AAN6M0A4_9PLEO|nr:hypothetical protein GRF29_44g2443573 [Pseudopithomyces chartarum]
MADETELRESLTARQLPEMTLSTEDNPLTAPKLPPDNFSAAQRAQYRFSVTGNVIITGGAGALALETATALLEHGASGLALWDLNPDASFPAIKALHQKFPTRKIITQALDVRSDSEISTALTDTLKVLGSVSHLICFAGVVDCTPAIDMTPESWRRTHDINLTGSFLCAQAFARQFEDGDFESDEELGGRVGEVGDQG